MVENKASAVKETKTSSQEEIKFFQSNHEYKQGDKICLFIGDPEDYKNGLTDSHSWPQVYARYNFKSKTQYNPEDWTTTDPTPREKVTILFSYPGKENKSIEIDVTELVEKYFNKEDLGITEDHPLRYVVPNFKGMRYEGVENGRVVKVQSSGSVTSDSIQELRKSIQQLFETSLVNQRQLESAGSMASRIFRDFEGRTILPAFLDF